MTLKLNGPLVLAGAGNMGGAMLAGWLAGGLDPKMVIVQDPAPASTIGALMTKHGIVPTAAAKLERAPAVLLMAVKPQAMETVFPPLAAQAGAGTLVLSIAAGKTIASFERHLAHGLAVVRAMPNTPAAIGRGITVAVGNAHVRAEQKALATALLAAIGAVAWVDEEALIDAVTAVSGSGPAYVFLLAECLAEAGVKAGLPRELAEKLARATVAGSGELLHRSELSAATLRQNVTSPNGTTFAALQVLMGERGLAPLLTEAVAAATRRSRELAG